MATFDCTVQTQTGRQLRRIQAPNILAARDELGPGELIHTYREIAGDGETRAGWVPREQLTLFYDSVANSLRAGIPLPEAIRAVGRDVALRRLSRVALQVCGSIDRGLPLSAAMAELPHVFGDAQIALVRASEEAGTLPEALADLAESRRNLSKLARRVSTSLAYPGIVAGFALLVISFVLVVLTPKQVGLFHDMGMVELPFTTTAMLWWSAHFWCMLLLFLIPVILFALVLLSLLSTRQGRVTIDYWKVRIPGIGAVLHQAMLARFYVILRLLVRHGTPLPRALEAAGAASGNLVLAAGMRRAVDRIFQGERVADALSDAEVLPDETVARIRVAERNGDLAPLLTEQASASTERAYTLSVNYCAIAEPALILLMGIFVAWTITGMYLPLLAIIRSLSG